MNFMIDLLVMIFHFFLNPILCLIHLEVEEKQLQQLIKAIQVIMCFTSTIRP
jgi:hypothetical protein